MATRQGQKLEPSPPRLLAAEDIVLVSDRVVWLHPERTRLAVGTIVAALLLHFLVVVAFFVDWQPNALPEMRPIQVTLREEPPPPPPPPPPPEPPKPKPEPEKPPPPPPPPPPSPPQPEPQPPEIKPRVSGPDEKTEAKKTDKPETNIPATSEVPTPKAEEEKPPELPEPPAPKPTPPRVTERETATGKGEVKPVERLLPAPLPQRPAAPPIKTLVLHLPSQGGGTGERDTAGDAYLNRLLHIIDSHRQYPPAEAFSGADSRVAVFALVMEPTGEIVTLKLLRDTGVPKLDEMARQMLTDSAPFPHLPPDYPQIRTPITIFIPIYPRR